MKKNLTLFLLWLILSLSLGGYLANGLWGQESADTIYLPDGSSHGHYQIELACNTCHVEGFAGEEAMQQACTECHAAELKQADDSHPAKKFKDPRNADRIAILDARYCITCHVEHVPDQTRTMGVTLADDFCLLCHREVGVERPSHKDLPFDGCSAAGCHNYHDNRALYEDFLVKHADDEPLKESALLPARNYQVVYLQQGKTFSPPLSAEERDSPATINNRKLIVAWSQSTHAEAGVNCSDCHQSGDHNSWQQYPAISVCKECHQGEIAGFNAGRHGMRLAQNLDAMTPENARLAMNPQAHNNTLNCNSCHDVHSVNTQAATVDACLTCHDDQHSKAYKQSRHFQLWQAEQRGQGTEGSGVSCASCHLPRIEVDRQIRVQHNQNDNLRPNEKMIRSVCMHCHGLAFSIDALADQKLIQHNFNGEPGQHIESIDWAIRRINK